MTIDPHTAERLILIGCKNASARKHALRLFLDDRERDIWTDLVRSFLNDTVKYDSTSCAVFVDPQYKEWPETQAVVSLTQDHYKQARINQNTVEAIGDAQGRNFVRNLRLITLRPDAFRDARVKLPSMKGRTCVIVGAGPSLQSHGQLLADHTGPIIAVNTSAGACKELGASPDAVVCTESKLVREGIDLMDKRASLFAMDLIGHSGNWLDEGETFTNPQLAFVGTEPNLAPYAHTLDLLPLAYGSSCTTAAVSLAFACGAERVALVGQDCAFQVIGSDGYPPIFEARMYAHGTPYEMTAVTIHTHRMRALVQKPTVPAHEVDVALADGLNDKPVWTTHSMLSFAHWFRDQPEDVRTRIVNSTAFGARIEGIAELPLAQAIDRGGEAYAVTSNPMRGFGLEDSLTVRARKVIKHLVNVGEHGMAIRNGDAFLLEWARRHPILNMWVGPERLRMRRMEDLSSAERGHRVAATVRRACSEIVACARGEL